MHIFLSYSSRYRDQADDICCRLQALGHEVFFDHEDLPAGISFDDLIRQAIESADLFIFLVSPEAVEQGRYTRTELKLAQRKWPTPHWHVLPVMIAPTPFDAIPAYLRSLTLLQPEGNLTAEVVMEVEDRVRAHGAPPAGPADTATDARDEAHTPKDAAEGGYRSLSFRFSGDETRGFAVHMGPGGAQSPPPALALDPAQVESALWAHATPIAGAARRGTPGAPPSRLPSGADARKIGQTLYEALFDSIRGEQLREQLRTLDPQRGDGLRFIIDTTEAPALARLPWEFLYSPRDDDFLFADRLKPVVRWLDVDAPPPSLAVAPPLRMLMAVAAPADRPELAVGTELAHLDSALAELAAAGVLETTRLEHASLEKLDAAMLEHQPHVLHFIGHGDCVDDDGVLLLESDHPGGPAEAIAGRRLAVLLRNYRSHLRLVFLNSCMGAASAQGDPFGGVAQSLIRRGIPAVIAMQFPIPDDAAVALARHFYRYLAAGQPVDAALSSARAFLYARGFPVEWGAPALHMRSPDGRLFDLKQPHLPPTAAAPQTMAPPAATAPAPAPSPVAPRSTSRLWLVGGIVVALAGASIAAWLLMSPASEDTGGEPVSHPPDIAPPPPPPPPMVEPPVKTPAERAQASIDAVISDLENNQLARAEATLGTLLDAEDPAVQATLRGPSYGTLLDALDQAIDRADASGNALEAERLSALLSRLSPDEPVMVPDTPALPPPAALTAILKQLDTGDADGAITQLETLSDTTVQEWNTSLSDDTHQALVTSVANAASDALRIGNQALAERAIAQLRRIEPSVDWRIDPPEAAAPPDDRLYRVRRGDTLWGLSQRFLGDGRQWPVFMENHNARVSVGRGGDLITHPDKLTVGQRLHLPERYDPLGRAIYEYRVMPGDTLSGIAWRVYGDASLWPILARDNAATISHPDRLFVGQTLTLRPTPGDD
ncbi:CHAT domain-containing protein [Nitrogeniibacter aestuarii]|uniref:CHAT domain-containing protein n=1 Tax=Nitrogeniibacter aestuarii TaxID=2815343 RepID=UPI001D12CBBA|nr:CHAT domain-containing protein [Nitrogeniibacter aestuarii]